MHCCYYYYVQMYGFQVVDDEGRSKKLWCHSQQACQEWCHFLTHWANTEVLLSHWYHVQWSKLLGRYALDYSGCGVEGGHHEHGHHGMQPMQQTA